MTNLYRQSCNWYEPEIIAKELVKRWGQEGFIWLDGDNSKLGRWITLAANPIDQICCRGLPKDKNSTNPFEALRNLNKGHWTGWISYEAGAWTEPKNPWKTNDMATLWIASHDPIFKFDLQNKVLWLEGYNEKRRQQVFRWLNRLAPLERSEKDKICNAPQIPLNSWKWQSSITNYSKNVSRIKEFISQGDIFQANLTTGCTTELSNELSAMTIFEQLRKKCPAPFSGVMIGSDNALGEAVISTSPERFLQVDPKGEIETRPIKGTRPRNKNLETAKALDQI